jgi:hypothetical protein
MRQSPGWRFEQGGIYPKQTGIGSRPCFIPHAVGAIRVNRALRPFYDHLTGRSLHFPSYSMRAIRARLNKDRPLAGA